MYYDEPDLKTFVGKQLKSIELNKEKDVITFNFKDNSRRILGVEGGCCSHSWIEHLTMPNNIDGATILSVDEPKMPPWDNHKCEKENVDDEYSDNKCGHDSLDVYHTNFHTDKGNIVLEYRNDSNGYYGGNLIDMETGNDL